MKSWQKASHVFPKILLMAGDIAAGVGAFVLASAQKVWRVFANDEDTEALKYLAKNVKENRLQAKVEVSVYLYIGGILSHRLQFVLWHQFERELILLLWHSF